MPPKQTKKSDTNVRSKALENVNTFLGESQSDLTSISEDISQMSLRSSHARNEKTSMQQSTRRTPGTTPQNSRDSQPQQRTERNEEEESEASTPEPRNIERTLKRPGPARRKPGPNKGAKKRKNYDPCTREIIKLQRTTQLLIPRLPFSRVVKEILHNREYGNGDLRLTTLALAALHESTELYLTHLLTDAYKCTLHRGRVTLDAKDIRLARFIRGPNDPGNKIYTST